MKLWLISQDINTGYDTFDACVVAAETEDAARMMNPDGEWSQPSWQRSWCESPTSVKVLYLGEAVEGTKPHIVLSSFNAG